MTAILLLHLWFGVTRTAEIPAFEVYQTGYLSAYAPGLAERVMQRRIRLWDQLHPEYGYVPECLIALNEHEHLNSYVVVFYEAEGKHTRWLLCYVVDVAQEEHAEERYRRNLIGEVDYNTFQRYGNGPVTIALLPERRTTWEIK